MFNQKTTVFVDFDGTLYQRDSLLDFLVFTVGAWKAYTQLLFLLPEYFFSADKAVVKNKWLQRTLGHASESELQASAKRFIPILEKKLNNSVLSKIEQYQLNQAEIVVLSASLDLWIKPFCANRGYSCIATPSVFRQQRFAGFEVKENVKGKLKLTLAQEHAHFSSTHTVAFGNEKSDLLLLRAVNEGYWVSGNNITCVK
jgi:phosphatidylglycerophosphatase C